ncbi:MAG TPA: cupin domain-containing protein [Sedimentisphaerales bacterium]|nr:cupin domain-containing protein [Sedimentisphaerales bacterium]
MTYEKERPGVLEACVSKTQRLADLVEYSKDSIVSKTIIDKPVGTITLFAFDKGQKLSEHTTPYDAVVQVLDGNGMLTIDSQDKHITTGEIIIMPGNVPHAVTAQERFKMLLTMIRA